MGGSQSRGADAPADLRRGLQRVPKFLPCRFLYDEEGSRLYEQITKLPEYYPYQAEAELLEAHAQDMIRHIPRRSIVVELGCGDGSKTATLLRALLARDGPEAVRFVGVDVSAEALAQLARNLAALLPAMPGGELVQAEHAVGVAHVRAAHPRAHLTLLFMGSSIGNYSHAEGTALLAALRAAAAGGDAQLLLAADAWKDARALGAAYGDGQGVTERFILNGMRHVLRELGHPAAERDPAALFAYCVEVNPAEQRVEMYLQARERLADLLPGVSIKAGERVLMEISRKYTPHDVAALAADAGLCLEAAWGDPRLYRVALLAPPAEALRRAWADTDRLYACVADWGAQPNQLRHPFCFYYGHVAAFSKLKLLREAKEQAMDRMLSRGIDPHCLDPSQCHSHPEAPATWPRKGELEAYVAGVRQKLLLAVCGASGACVDMRALGMVLEHERMHQETLCHMVALQRKREFDAAVAAPMGASKSAAVIIAPPEGTPRPGSYYMASPLCSYRAAALPPLPPAAAALEPAGPAPEEPAVPDADTSLVQRLLAALGLATELQPEDGADTSSMAEDEGPAAAPAGPEPARPERIACCAADAACPAGYMRLAGGEVTLGLDPTTRRTFVWDNELGQKAEALRGVLVSVRPVSVRQFVDFVERHKGYERRGLWDPTFWALMQASGWRLPPFWSRDARGGLVVHAPEGSYSWQAVADCPAWVSLREAEAYCRLHGGRVMTEAEYQLAAEACGASALAGAGPAATDGEGACAGAGAGASPSEGKSAGPAGAAASTCSPPSARIEALDCGGFEWTSTALEPFPGFAPDALYPEYSCDFFDGRHFVLRGASPFTHPALAARPSFRNFYQPELRGCFAKFRVVRDLPE